MLITNLSVFENDRFITATAQVKDGKLLRLFAENEPLPHDERADGHKKYLFPAPVDLHVHGCGGFGTETDDLLSFSRALATQGVGAFAPTFYSAPVDRLCADLKKCAAQVGKEKGAKIVGFHVEGPFLSPFKKGVMRAEDICMPSLKAIEQLYAAAQGHLFSITLAPELLGSEEVIKWCLQKNILVQIGHTHATYAETKRAKEWGARHITHLGNAMTPFHHRELGALGAALADTDFSCEIIADGVHLSPELIRFLHRIKPTEKIVLVTDALRPTGQKEGPFFANHEEVVLQDKVWKRKSDGVIAGSALTMLTGMKNLTSWGFTAAEAVGCAVLSPARLAGLQTDSLPLVLTDEHFSLLSLIHRA